LNCFLKNQSFGVEPKKKRKKEKGKGKVLNTKMSL